jgi:3'-phosphoadenosine 5'-phosphosulfate sulfotransferase (PAPS reductase)/FAD synthetase
VISPGLAGAVGEAKERLRRMVAEFEIEQVFCLTSGGNDSSVTAHMLRDHYSALVHVDTGTSLPEPRGRNDVLAFVERFATLIDKPLLVYSAGDAFETMVLGRDYFWTAFEEARGEDPGLGLEAFIDRERAKPDKGVAPGMPLGFPGPGGHRFPYRYLKERQVDTLIREHKRHRLENIGLLTGVRAAESLRRMGWTTDVRKDGSKIWLSPILHLTDEQMAEYRAVHDLPQSDVAALLHRSGECNCGAFLARGEREEVFSLFPEFRAFIEPLEAEARRREIRGCRWGARPLSQAQLWDDEDAQDVHGLGAMCSSCVER